MIYYIDRYVLFIINRYMYAHIILIQDPFLSQKGLIDYKLFWFIVDLIIFTCQCIFLKNIYCQNAIKSGNFISVRLYLCTYINIIHTCILFILSMCSYYTTMIFDKAVYL